MKNIICTIIAVCTFATIGFGQENPEIARKIAAYRVATYTDVLRFTPEEAEGFWPVFNEYLDKRETVVAQLKPAKQLDSMNDAEVEDQIKKHFELKQKEIDLERDLVAKLRKVLPIRKIAKLPIAERQFRESLVKKLQEKREERMERRRNGKGK